jgi:hypothetical protein
LRYAGPYLDVMRGRYYETMDLGDGR